MAISGLSVRAGQEMNMITASSCECAKCRHRNSLISMLQYSKIGITETQERKETKKPRKIKTSVIKHQVVKPQNMSVILFFHLFSL